MQKIEFMQALNQALISRNTSDIDEIISDFENHFAAAVQEGKSEEEITAALGDPVAIAQQYPTATNHVAAVVARNVAAEPVAATGSPAADDSSKSNYSHPGEAIRPRNKAEKSGVATEDKTTGQNHYVYGQPNSNGTSGKTSNAVLNGTQTESAIPNQTDNGSVPVYQTGSDSVPPFQAGSGSVPPNQQGSGPATPYGPPAEADSGKIIALVFINLFIALPILMAVFGIVTGFWGTSFGVGIGAVALFVLAVLQQGVHVQILILFGISLSALSLLLLIASYHLTKACILGLIRYIRWNKTWVKEQH